MLLKYLTYIVYFTVPIMVSGMSVWLRMERNKIRKKRLTYILRISALITITTAMLNTCITFYEARKQLDSITAGLIVYSWLPYLVCLLLLVGKTNPLIPLFGASLPFFLDLIIYCSAATSSSSTAGIILLFMPFLDLLLFMPLGLLIGFLFAILHKKRNI